MSGWQKIALAVTGLLGIAAVAITYLLVVPVSEQTTIVTNVAVITAGLVVLGTALFSELKDWF